MWAVPSHSRLGGIVGMHYLSQMTWPVSFLSSPSFPFIHIMVWWVLSTSPFVWGVIRCGSLLLHAKEFTHLINNAAHEVHTLITQGPGQGPKDWDVILLQELGDCFSSLIGGHVCHYASATVLSHPFWYSNLKLNCTRAPTHWWPVASRLGDDIMYVSGLLSFLTRKDW